MVDSPCGNNILDFPFVMGCGYQLISSHLIIVRPVEERTKLRTGSGVLVECDISSIYWSINNGNVIEAKSDGRWIQKIGRDGIGSEDMDIMKSLVVRLEVVCGDPSGPSLVLAFWSFL